MLRLCFTSDTGMTTSKRGTLEVIYVRFDISSFNSFHTEWGTANEGGDPVGCMVSNKRMC